MRLSMLRFSPLRHELSMMELIKRCSLLLRGSADFPIRASNPVTKELTMLFKVSESAIISAAGTSKPDKRETGTPALEPGV